MEEKNYNFCDLGICNPSIQKLNELKITNPTNVQKKIIPLIIEGKSVLFQSETGTGKTFAFLLPLIQKINPQEKNVQVIIVAPTHELSSQIKNEISKVCDYKAVLCFGGAPLKRQIEALKEKPEFVIGSCTRIKELIFLKKLKLTNVKAIVFDEIDRLIESEVRDDSTDLVKLMPKDIQFVGCSATVSQNVKKVFETALSSLREENTIELIELPSEDILKKKIQHWAIFSESRQKIDTLRSFLRAANPEKVLIFTSKLDQVEMICAKLKYKKFDCEALHAKTDKIQRKSIIDRFRSGKLKILVTSDLASRGLDIQNVTHVIQMDLPSNEDFFIHRAGRTGRSMNSGINVVIGDAYEMRKFAKLEKKLGIIVYPKVLHSGKILDASQLEN